MRSFEMSTTERVTLYDLSLDDCRRSERVERLRTAYFEACPEICVERPQMVTRLHRELGLFANRRISALDKARVYRRVLETREALVWHRSAKRRNGESFEFLGDSLFAGSTTRKFKGVLVYPELLGLALWPELHTLPHRPANPYQLSAEDAAILNLEVFPEWLDRSVLERARAEAVRSELPKLQQPDFGLLQHMVFFLASKPNCVSHTIPDFSRAVREGLQAVIEDARIRAAVEQGPTRSLHEAIAEALQGIIAYSRRLGERAAEMARLEPDERSRTELEALAQIHRHVPEHPARTFREGLTTVWMCWIACHLENANVGLSLGRLDQLLYELYRYDLAAGELSVDDAVELCCCFWLKIGDHVPAVPETGEQLFGGSGSNQAITLGGVDREGHDAVNDLTYIMLRATELMGLRDPNLNARYMPRVNSTEYLRRLCQANVETRATPALHNDRAVIAAMMAAGDTLEQARDYGVTGCVEPGSNGRFYGHSGALLFNLTSALELALFNGRHRHTGLARLIGVETGAIGDFRSYAEFRLAFERQLRWMAAEAIKVNDALGQAHQAFYPTPILSALFEGPMQKGMDLTEGGAVINASGVAVIGLADTADSLTAIRRIVYEEKALSFTELLAAVQNDFIGHEALAARLMNPSKTQKWGNEEPAADESVHWIVSLLNEIFSERINYRGGRYRVGYWTMTNHAGFGRLMGALPSGRRARQNFTSGMTPVSGVTPQLTAVLNSVAAVPWRTLRNGVAFNLKFVPRPDDAAFVDEFVQIVEAYFGASDATIGGMEIQFNVTEREEFLAAMRDPEGYPELLVRVSGYTAYFKDLNPQMKQEILERTEYELRTGEATRPIAFQLGELGNRS